MVPETEPLLPLLPRPVEPPPEPLMPFDETWIRAGVDEPPDPQREEIIFSTFAGPPPDVWPVLQPEPLAQAKLTPAPVNMVGFWAMLLSAAAGFVAGMHSMRGEVHCKTETAT